MPTSGLAQLWTPVLRSHAIFLGDTSIFTQRPATWTVKQQHLQLPAPIWSVEGQYAMSRILELCSLHKPREFPKDELHYGAPSLEKSHSLISYRQEFPAFMQLHSQLQPDHGRRVFQRKMGVKNPETPYDPSGKSNHTISEIHNLGWY